MLYIHYVCVCVYIYIYAYSIWTTTTTRWLPSSWSLEDTRMSLDVAVAMENGFVEVLIEAIFQY